MYFTTKSSTSLENLRVSCSSGLDVLDSSRLSGCGAVGDFVGSTVKALVNSLTDLTMEGIIESFEGSGTGVVVGSFEGSGIESLEDFGIASMNSSAPSASATSSTESTVIAGT